MTRRFRESVRAARGYHNPLWRLRGEPWRMPRDLWRLPWYPVRLYLHAADRVLFALWWWSRPGMYWLEDRAYELGIITLRATDEGFE